MCPHHTLWKVALLQLPLSSVDGSWRTSSLQQGEANSITIVDSSNPKEPTSLLCGKWQR